MNILTNKLELPENYHGSIIGEALDILIRQARASNYDGCRLEWFDPSEGWVDATIHFNPNHDA